MVRRCPASSIPQRYSPRKGLFESAVTTSASFQESIEGERGKGGDLGNGVETEIAIGLTCVPEHPT